MAMKKVTGEQCDICGYFTEDLYNSSRHVIDTPDPESLPVGFIFKSTRGKLAHLLDTSATSEYLLGRHSPEDVVYQVVHHLNKPSQKDHSVIHGIFVYEYKIPGLEMSHNRFTYEQLEHYFAERFFRFITDIEMEEFRKNHPNLDDDEFKSNQLTNIVPEKLEERLAMRF